MHNGGQGESPRRKTGWPAARTAQDLSAWYETLGDPVGARQARRDLQEVRADLARRAPDGLEDWTVDTPAATVRAVIGTIVEDDPRASTAEMVRAVEVSA